MSSRVKFADELESILKALNDHTALDARQIAERAFMPTSHVVDLISNHLGHAVESYLVRSYGGPKITIYRLKGAS